MKKLVIVTTVTDTLNYILKGQPEYLSSYYEVTIVTSKGQLYNGIEKHGNINVKYIDMERGINPFFDLISIFKMCVLILKIKPDIIHSYTPKAGLVAMVSGWITRVPKRVHTFTGLIFPTITSKLKKKILMVVDRLICSCASTIVPEGNGVKGDLIDFKITNKNLELIGNGNIAGVDTNFFNQKFAVDERTSYRRKINIDDSSFLFCFVGRLTEDKGISELYNAFITLPEGASLIVVGDEDARSPLSHSMKQSLLEHPRIYLTGWLEDIRSPLSASNVLVLPSYREGFPNVPLQAGSMSIPSIVTDINGCNEIIRDGYNGWLVKPKDIDALKEAMHLALECENIELIGKNARLDVVNKFDRHLFQKELKRFYETL
ncbi:glycosyltransferase family 4 protein [Vibrio crassostreae]|uniref:glycosyltransferase family 4 protein n=1 Tax=Vibrio crassostreae TaxID=246167 RepID=UPI000F4DD6DE|nr:glycosyltransferase family 4 protein [Vibrio crassostreae]RPF00118.1 glycosyltransferase involved in cell wall biosynthesis [Vibrio crassostreae]